MVARLVGRLFVVCLCLVVSVVSMVVFIVALVVGGFVGLVVT